MKAYSRMQRDVKMAVIRCSFFSQFFLAMAIATFLANQATATVDLCEAAYYKGLCRAAVKGITEPTTATESAINLAIVKTRHAMALSRMLGQSETNSLCTEMYETALADLLDSLKNIKDGDVGALNTNLSAAISYYATCGDAFGERGQMSPLVKVSQVLSHMVDNCLALVPSNQI